MLARLKFDITDLVNEILDHIPDDAIINGTVLDPAIGGGQFVKEIERRKRLAGKTDQEISETVFGYEENILRRDYAVNKYKLKGNYIVDNFLERDFKDMKFDVIIGNPPYQDEHRSGNPLWPLFVKKGFELIQRDGYLSMITPGRWVLPGHNIKEDKIRIWDLCVGSHNTLSINLGECSKYFSEGNSADYFSYFITQKSNPRGLSKITSSDNQFDLDLTTVSWLPYRNCNLTTIRILKKISAKQHKSFNLAWKYDRSHNVVKETADNQFNIPIFFGKNTIKYSDHKSDLHNKKKVLFKLGRFIPYIDRLYIDNNGNMSYNSAYVALIDKNEDVSYLKSKLYIFIASCLFNGSEITAEGYRTLPRLPKNSWSDKDLYQHFGFTQDEINYIENADE